MSGARPYFQRKAVPSNVERARSDNSALWSSMREVVCRDGRARLVADVGSGPAIVFVPMIDDLAFVYAPLIEVLQSQYRTILYRPQVRLDRILPVADRVNELSIVLHTLAIERAHIVAWSDTGSVAYRFALEHPDQCASVTFLGVPDRYRLPLPIHLAMHALGRWPVPRLVPAVVFRHMLALFMRGPVVRYGDVVRVAESVDDLSRIFIYSCLPNMIEHRAQDRAMTMPALVVYGDADPVVRPKQALRFAALMGKNAASRFIAEGEHLLPWSNTVPVLEALSVFLSQSSSLPATPVVRGS